MLCFDPDQFLVTGEPPMTRCVIPGKKYAAYGLVREVWLAEEDLPYLMVCFTMKDVAKAMGIPLKQGSKYLDVWGWPKPKYRSRHPWMNAAAKGLSWKQVHVYTYPEAEVLFDAYDLNRVTKSRKFGRENTPQLAAQVTSALATIRSELESTYD